MFTLIASVIYSSLALYIFCIFFVSGFMLFGRLVGYNKLIVFLHGDAVNKYLFVWWKVFRVTQNSNCITQLHSNRSVRIIHMHAKQGLLNMTTDIPLY